MHPDVRMVGKVKAETEENIRYEEYRGGKLRCQARLKGARSCLVVGCLLQPHVPK